MKMTELVTYERDERIATIVMDDGKVNAFSIPMLKAVHAAFDQAERDGAIVILTGREGYFSAGFDLKVFAGGDVAEVIEMLTLGATLAERILGFATPVITACPGHTVAAGAFMALAADMRIGIDGPYRIGLNEVKIGLTVPWFVIELARQRLQPAELNRSVISATMYNPSEAVAAGFFDRTVPADELRTASIDAAATLAELNPAAHTATKLRVRGPALKAIRSAIETELTPEGLGGAGAPV
jgi:enoyl-CoA hydratase